MSAAPWADRVLGFVGFRVCTWNPHVKYRNRGLETPTPQAQNALNPKPAASRAGMCGMTPLL